MFGLLQQLQICRGSVGTKCSSIPTRTAQLSSNANRVFIICIMLPPETGAAERDAAPAGPCAISATAEAEKTIRWLHLSTIADFNISPWVNIQSAPTSYWLQGAKGEVA